MTRLLTQVGAQHARESFVEDVGSHSSFVGDVLGSLVNEFVKTVVVMNGADTVSAAIEEEADSAKGMTSTGGGQWLANHCRA